MGYEHLSDSDCTTPSNIIILADLDLSTLIFVQTWQSQEHLHLLQIILQQGPETMPITEPKETPEALLKVLLDSLDMLSTTLTISVLYVKKFLMQEHYW